MADQVQMSALLRQCLQRDLSRQAIPGFTIKGILGCGSTAVTYEVEDQRNRSWALKLVSRECYGERAPRREVARFAHAKDDRFLALVQDIGDCILEVGGATHEFIWFKSKCIEGQSLRDFFSSGCQFSAKTEVLRFAETITAALEELSRLGFSHGDLHEGNIMRQEIGEGGSLPEIRYVVIDFSEAHALEATEQGLRKDLESFGQHLRTFYDVISQREGVSREAEKVLGAIAHIPGLLNGAAFESTGISTATAVLERLMEGLAARRDLPRELSDPFQFLNADDIANDALLADLCFADMWWTSELEKNSNVLLIGPRGCGKTMIFRRLRLKTKVAAEKFEEIESDTYLGFFLPCESLFYMRFSDLSEVDVDANSAALTLFWNMCVLSEVCSTLSVLPDSLGPVPRAAVRAVSELAREEIGALWEELCFPTPLASFDELATCAEEVECHIRRSIASGQPVPSRGSGSFVTRLVQAVKRNIAGVSDRCFFFFLDDYTRDRVPLALQNLLHPIVCQRSSDLCFKISAHMFGSIYGFPRPLALDEGRNIMVINLGTAYLKRSRNRREADLLVRILNKRFESCPSYAGKIEDWLGHTSHSGRRSLSRALHDEKTRPRVCYHGVDCLKRLCTGDYSEMIRMVGAIFKEAKIGPNTPIQRIPPQVQDRAIRDFSREYLSRIRRIRPDGHKLYDVVNSFGELSKKLLYDRRLVRQGANSRGRPRWDPYDMLDVYIDDLTTASGASRRIWERLRQASIFINNGVATSRRSVIADRATLRRIYCPAFRTALTSSERLSLTKDEFEDFMFHPQEFCDDSYKKAPLRFSMLPLWKQQTTQEVQGEAEGQWVGEQLETSFLPDDKDKVDYLERSPKLWVDLVSALPALTPVETAIGVNAAFDLYIGAMGFEERTTQGARSLVSQGAEVEQAVLLEFDRYYQATEKRRAEYEGLLLRLTGGRPYRPFNAPIGSPDLLFSKRMNDLLRALAKPKPPRVVFDCTSCPSLILSQSLACLLSYHCDLTILYSEAAAYFPTRGEWESMKQERYERIHGPFTGVSFVAKPPILQADDSGELPVLLFLFPTFSTERTDGVLAELNPAARIWFFGEPHDLAKNFYRIEMAKAFAAPITYPGDSWSTLDTFDYRRTLQALVSAYSEHRRRYRIVVMPHGSKMQTLGTNLFATAYQLSMVFAMPQEYDPKRYSAGCLQVWAIPLGQTQSLVRRLRSRRVLPVQNMWGT